MRPNTCPHAWDTNLHRACPRCAIAGCERRFAEAWRLVEQIRDLAVPCGSDCGHGAIAKLAQQALEALDPERLRLAGESLAGTEVRRG